MKKVNRTGERKTITLSDFIFEIMNEEMEKRGGRTTYTSLINEALAEKYSNQLRIKQLEKKAKLQSND
jgi:methyltransferase-like protein